MGNKPRPLAHSDSDAPWMHHRDHGHDQSTAPAPCPSSPTNTLKLIASLHPMKAFLWVSALGFVCSAAGQAFQHPLSTDSKRALTPDIVDHIQAVIKQHNVPGLSLAVIHADGETEFGAWGNKTEDGDPMTPDVSLRRRELDWLTVIRMLTT